MSLQKYFSQCTSGGWKTSKTTDTQYKIEEDDDTLSVIFQGSVSRLDWLYNFWFSVIPYKKMSNLFFVHAGFLKKYKSIREDVRFQALKAKSLRKKFKLLGFSQGGSLAIVAHEDIRSQLGMPVETIVFGASAVFSFIGGKVLRSRLENVTRVENGNDIVTKILGWLLYKHYGKVVHIGKPRKWYKLSIKDHTTYKENL